MRQTKGIYFVLGLLFSLIYSTPIYGQCCSAGNPAGGDGGAGSIGFRDLMISADYHRGYSRDYYHGSEKYPVSSMENSYFDFTKIKLTYGLHPRFTIGAEIGYFFDKTQNLNLLSGPQKIQSQGLGDLGLTLRANLLKKLFFNPNKLILLAGTILPVGAFNEESDGVVIPISLQPSSGTPKYHVGLYFFHKRKDKKLGWDTRVFFEYRSTIEKNFLFHQYGPLLLAEAGMLYSNEKKLSFKVKGKLAYHFQDYRENELLIESSGGVFTSLCPMVYYQPTKMWGIIASFDIPLYRTVKGYQLTQLYGFRIGVKRKIKFSKDIEEH